MYLNSVTIVGFVGADPGNVSRAITAQASRFSGRHAAILEEHAGRVVLKDRMASHLHLPSAISGIRRAGD